MRQSNHRVAKQAANRVFHQLTPRLLRTVMRSLSGLSMALAVPVTIPVAALVLMLVPGMVAPAHATTADCNILNSASYTANANGNFSLNLFQLFTLDNGEVISFNSTIPAGATVVITYAGQTVTLTSSSSSGTITVNESGGSSTSAVLIRVSGLITGGSVTVNFNCAGVTSTQNNNTSAPTPTAVINRQYGAVADAGVEALITFPGFGAPIGRAQEDLSEEALERATKQEIEELRRTKCSTQNKEFERLDAIVRPLEFQPPASDAEFENFGNLLGQHAVAFELLQACLGIDSPTPFFGGTSIFINSTTYAPFPKPSPGERAINKAVDTPYTYSATLNPGIGGGITGKFALSNPKVKRPWVIFLNSGVSGLDDDRSGADRRARIWNVSTGAKIRWNPKTTFGLSAGYRHGTVTSKANASKLTGDYFSATISGDYLLMKALSLGLSATHTHGENTLAIGGGSGDFGVDVFNASLSLSGAFKWQELTVSPSLSAGISHVNRDGYTDSLGIIVPGSEKTHGNVNFGTSISKTFRFVDGFKSITPSVSLGGGYFFREKFDATLTSGTVAKQFGFGANLATGLDLRMDNGIGLNFGGSYGLFQNDIQIWSFNARVTKVF